MTDRPIHLAAALDGAGWHPAAWRLPDARPTELFGARYWTEVVQEAERGLLDLVTIEDSLGQQSDVPYVQDDRTDQVRGRLDAVLIAARVAPVTAHIGLVPTIVTTHTEPFHISKAIATLDHVSHGRGGVRVQVSGKAHEAGLFGRRELPAFTYDDLRSGAADDVIAELFGEAEDYVEVIRRLWDSWEDDAEIRDAETGRFVDVDKLHYIDFEGRWFSVRGPSITQRPPQGQPLVVALAHSTVPYRLAARSADLALVTPTDRASAETILGEVRAEQAAAGRADETVHVFGDLVVLLDDTSAAAEARKARLDELAGAEFQSDARIFVGTPSDLADLLLDWQQAGLTGFRLRPAAVPHDLAQITRGLVPELQRRGAFRITQPEGTLRDRLGLARPANRYATV